MAFAYSFCGKREKVLEIANLLPDTAYSKRELLSLSVPAKERAGYKSECILAHSESILCDVLCISKHHYLWGDPEIAIDVCNRALNIINALGDEGYLLYFKASAYEDLSMAYAKLKNKEKMFNAMETVIQIYEEIENELKDGSYFFSTAINQNEAIEEAQWTVSAIKGYSISYPVVYDCEGFKNSDSRMYITSYLTTDLSYKPPVDDGIKTEFQAVNEQITAKSETNLRTLPSVTDSEVVYTLKKGEYLTRTGISTNGWSRLEYNGQTVYAVSSYLTE